jgi:hypothetical protein
MGKWSKKIDEKEFKISEESAEAAVRELLDFYDIGVEDEDKNAPDFNKALDNLALCYRRGQLENSKDDKGFTVIQHLKGGETLAYQQLKASHKKVLDAFKDTETTARTYALMGKLCGLGSDAITKLGLSDLRATEALSLPFFMAC